MSHPDTDITRQHALSQELELDRLRLRDINRRLRQYGETVAEVTQEKELLAAKFASMMDWASVCWRPNGVS